MNNVSIFKFYLIDKKYSYLDIWFPNFEEYDQITYHNARYRFTI